jgi:hypothetical protein
MRVQKNSAGQIGYLIAGVIVLDIFLAIWLLWRAFDGKPDSAASVQAIAAIIGLVLQVLLIAFNVRGRQTTTSQLLSTFASNRLVQAGSVCIAFVLALLLAFDLGASYAAVQIVTFTDQDVSLDILQAEKLSTEAEVTTQFGENLTFVRQETKEPGRAHGTVAVINTVVNSQGYEVRYIIDATVTVPAAVSETTATRSSITYGQILVGITAIEPGDSSIVGANTVIEMIIPGQQPIYSQHSNFIFQNAPITNIAEQTTYTYVPNEKDRQWQLDDALTKLYDEGIRRLRNQANQLSNNLKLDSITPDRTELTAVNAYELAYVPPNLQDSKPHEPVKVTVRTRFIALATPNDKPLNEQLNAALPAYLSQLSTKYCAGTGIESVAVTKIKWDGDALKVSGVVSCSKTR